MNLFATVLTYPAPSANYRGESEENRSVIQKITYGRFEYPIISPESMRNALRETLASYGLPRNRTRLNDEDQLAVKFADYPDPDNYADDFFFGYLVAASGTDRKKIQEAVKEKGRDEKSFQFKRDSILRMNLARGVEPYRNNAVFTQSPLTSEDSPWQNAKTSALLHRETALTAFQYPFALNLDDCKAKPDWTRSLLKAIGELNGVAGNHARSYFEMAPASIVLRLYESTCRWLRHVRLRLLPAISPRSSTASSRETIRASEFHIGGKIVKDMDAKRSEELKGKGVTLDRDPRRLLADGR